MSSERAAKDELPGISALMQLPPWDGSNLSPLTVPQKILGELGNPQDTVPTIHVAGTNGKGTLCTSLAAIAHAAGQKVGQFASPHLNDVSERCLLGGVPVSPEIFDEALQRVFSVMERQGLSSSYFVVGAVASMLVFSESDLDLAIIEVGLGGRYDATNVMHSPRATVITGVSLDHTHILGDTIEKIAWNKAGIMKRGVPCFLGKLDSVSASVCKKEASDVACDLSQYVEGEEDAISLDNPLFGAAHQRRNAALASRVASALGYSDECIRRGLESARWPGRMERLGVARSDLIAELALQSSDFNPARSADVLHFLLDAAHNPEGLSATLEHLGALDSARAEGRIFLLTSVLERKQWGTMLELLDTFRQRYSSDLRQVVLCFARSTHQDSVDPQKLARSSSDRVFGSAKDSLAFFAREGNSEDLIVVLGSIFFLADIRPRLGAPAFRSIES